MRARHRQMMDQMLRNREHVLQQIAELQKKLDAAEKVELYRRIRVFFRYTNSPFQHFYIILERNDKFGRA